jgi:imidazolonepropionase-like amidohydrolase
VDVGKDADIVLLSGDPTEDVANLHDIAGVVRAGRYYSAEFLSSTLEAIATAHSAV